MANAPVPNPLYFLQVDREELISNYRLGTDKVLIRIAEKSSSVSLMCCGYFMNSEVFKRGNCCVVYTANFVF